MTIKYILFDIDDTLFPSSEFAELARKNAIRSMVSMGVEKDADKIYARLLTIIKKKGSNYSKHFDELCKSFKIKRSERYVAAAIVAYHNTKTSIMPFPRVPRLLIKLKEKGYKLYVATNGSTIKQWDKLIRLRLALYFDDVFVSQEIGEKKGKTFFKKVLKKLKARPGECMMVGDREDADIAPAKALGMITVKIKQGKYAKQKSSADYKIRDPGELLSIL